jgi:hypothetical protein
MKFILSIALAQTLLAATASRPNAGTVINGGNNYRVASGDTCYNVAQNLKLDFNKVFVPLNPGCLPTSEGGMAESLKPNDILALNNAGKPARIFNGSKVMDTKANACKKNTGRLSNNGNNYIVGSGDNCWCIAANLGLDYNTALLALNPGCAKSTEKLLKPNDVLALNASGKANRKFNGKPVTV